MLHSEGEGLVIFLLLRSGSPRKCWGGWKRGNQEGLGARRWGHGVGQRSQTAIGLCRCVEQFFALSSGSLLPSIHISLSLGREVRINPTRWAPSALWGTVRLPNGHLLAGAAPRLVQWKWSRSTSGRIECRAHWVIRHSARFAVGLGPHETIVNFS